MEKPKAQISIEYIVIISFVAFMLIGVLGIAYAYTGGIKDSFKMIQVNNFGNEIISTAENVFYQGGASKKISTLYAPIGIQDIEIDSNELIISVALESGITKTSYTSKVPLHNGGEINPLWGTKLIQFLITTSPSNQVFINSSFEERPYNWFVNCTSVIDACCKIDQSTWAYTTTPESCQTECIHDINDACQAP